MKRKKYLRSKKRSFRRKKTRKYNRRYKGGSDEDIDCPICLLTRQELTEQNIPLGKLIPCNHDMCKSCFDRLPIVNDRQKECPLCRTNATGLRVGEIVYEPTDLADQAFDQAIITIRNILGPDWAPFNNGSSAGYRYLPNDGRGIALPRTRTFYGAQNPQRYGSPFIQQTLEEINAILDPFDLQTSPLLDNRGYFIGINRKIRRN